MKNTIASLKRTRKGFSLVELVVVILIIAILAVAVFAGGSAAIKKSQVARTTSDLHNFSIAIESALNETPSVANVKAITLTGAANDMKDILDCINENLPADYALGTTAEAAVTNANLNITVADTTDPHHVVLKSAKTDAWGNPYYVILDCGERHNAGISDFYVTVVSAGPNAQTNVGGNIEEDDIFLLAQYTDGDVVATIYDVSDATLKNAADTELGHVSKGTAASSNQGVYISAKSGPTVDGSANLAPVNF